MNHLLSPELQRFAATDLNDTAAVGNAALAMERLLLAEPANTDDNPAEVYGAELVRASNDLYERYETNLEIEFASRVLSGEAAVQDYPLYERFMRLVGHEVELAKIKPFDKVLFIGSGPFPISPLLTHEISGGARVDCFDLSQAACETSRLVLGQLGLEGAIGVANVTAQDAKRPTVSTIGDMGSYDTIILALLAQPKRDILSRIRTSVVKGTRLIIRNSEGSRRLLYAGMDADGLDRALGFVTLAEYHAGSDDTISGTVAQTDYQPWIYRI